MSANALDDPWLEAVLAHGGDSPLYDATAANHGDVLGELTRAAS